MKYNEKEILFKQRMYIGVRGGGEVLRSWLVFEHTPPSTIGFEIPYREWKAFDAEDKTTAATKQRIAFDKKERALIRAIHSAGTLPIKLELRKQLKSFREKSNL